MNDTNVLDLLVKKHDDIEKAAAEALGVSPQQFNNWRRRGIPPAKRAIVWQAAREAGAELSFDWISAKPQGRKAKSAARKARDKRKPRDKRRPTPPQPPA
jgi:hypothetical protein